MSISELTKELAALKKEHGDIVVSFIHRAGELEMTVRAVDFQPKGPLPDAPAVHRGDDLPERVLIELRQYEPSENAGSKAVC